VGLYAASGDNPMIFNSKYCLESTSNRRAGLLIMHHNLGSVFLIWASSPHPLIECHTLKTITYDHKLKRIGHPVRSAIHKLGYPLDNSLNQAS
jgi:hypothetical protein